MRAPDDQESPIHVAAGARYAVRRLVLSFKYARKARLTALPLRNSAATSGSSNTTFVPWAYRSAYLPRMPPEKSYSARSALEVTRRLAARDFRFGVLALEVLLAFFILAPFTAARRSSADDADVVAALGVSDDEKSTAIGAAKQ